MFLVPASCLSLLLCKEKRADGVVVCCQTPWNQIEIQWLLNKIFNDYLKTKRFIWINSEFCFALFHSRFYLCWIKKCVVNLYYLPVRCLYRSVKSVFTKGFTFYSEFISFYAIFTWRRQLCSCFRFDLMFLCSLNRGKHSSIRKNGSTTLMQFPSLSIHNSLLTLFANYENSVAWVLENLRHKQIWTCTLKKIFRNHLWTI